MLSDVQSLNPFGCIVRTWMQSRCGGCTALTGFFLVLLFGAHESFVAFVDGVFTVV